MLMGHFAGAFVRSDFLRRFMQFAVALAELQFLFFKILFRQSLDHATAVEAVGRVVGVPYSIIKGERFVSMAAWVSRSGAALNGRHDVRLGHD